MKKSNSIKQDYNFFMNILHVHETLTLQEMADLCEVPVKTVEEWVRKGNALIGKKYVSKNNNNKIVPFKKK